MHVAMVGQMRMETVKLKSTHEWSVVDKMRFQDYLVALLYQHYPLRNDFIAEVIGKRQYNKLTDADTKERNYLVREPGNVAVINEYKTSQKYGRKVIAIDNNQVLCALRKWLRHNVTGYMLTNSRGGAMQPNGVSKLLSRVGKQRLGKSLGSSLLRHSYLSHKYADVAKEKAKDADLMMHSEAMQQAYIK